MDAVKNFAIATVSQGYDASATSIVLASGGGARFPAVPFNACWWDATNYPNPADDPKREIVRVTAITTDTLTITRGQEVSLGGLAASTKNTAAATYKIAAMLTAQYNADVSELAVDVGTETIWVTETGYAATGDGTTDDRVAIQNAITDGNLVIFPPGTYIVGAALVLKDNLCLRGAGIGITTIKLKSSAGAEHVIKDDGTSMVRVTIEDMTIDGNQTNNASALDGISFLNGADRVTLNRVEVINCRRKGIATGLTAGSTKHLLLDGIHVKDCLDNLVEVQNRNNDNVSVLISDFHLDNPGGGSGTSKSGIVFSGPVQITNGTIEGVSGTNSCLGIFGREDGDSSAGNGGHDSHIQNVHIKGAVHASNIGEGIRLDCDRCMVQGCMVDSLDYGFRSGTSSSTGDDNVFIGCASNAGDVGFRIEGDRVVVQGCKIIGTPTLGVDVRSTATDTALRDNYITGTTKVTNSGTTTHARGNIGWKTQAIVQTADINATSGPDQSFTVAHGLDVTPAKETCALYLVNTGTTPDAAADFPNIRGPFVNSTDGTNVVLDMSISTSGTDATVTFKIAINIDALP